ncbi:MAG: sigma-70 family RNA polymerase sigma factor [Pseudomonadota bacterium]
MTGDTADQGSNPSGGVPAADSVALDAELLARIAQRDEQAFREVIADHSQMLHRIAYRMIGQPQEAEDIVQEVMLRLWDHAPRLSQKVNGAIRLGAWLKRVAVNLAIDRLRVAKRASGEEVPEQEDAAPLADREMEEREESNAARSLVTELPEKQRAAIVLTYYEELPNSQAAEAMDMNIKAFESLLYRARGALRNAYREREGGTAQ